MNKLMQTGAVFGLLGVLIGAFGAHAVRNRITPDLMQVYETGVHYHFIHALAILAVAALFPRLRPKLAMASGWLFGIGIVIFSGSLYVLAITGVKILGAITPIGGLCFIAGWITLILAARPEGSKEAS